ncbi:long-chain fatty acid--CoA ligase [soil metagenome]
MARMIQASASVRSAPHVAEGVAVAGLRIAREPWLGGTALSYPDRVPTVVDALDRAIREFGRREAIVAPEGRFSYTDLGELVEGAVARLREEGLRPGDRLAIAARNGIDLAVALLACARGGFVMVGLNVRLRAPQWAYMLSHSGARLAIAADEFAVDLAAAGKEAGLEPERVRNVDDLMTGRRQTWGFTAEQRPAEDATFAVVYTSGTTGRPKASRVVHRCSIHSATTYVHVIGMTGADRTAVAFPLYYITGLHAHLLPMMLVGGTSVLLADARPREYVAALAAERITWMYVVPSFWLLLLREEGFRWPALGHVVRGAFGGSPFPARALAQIRERMPQLRLFDIYGLSETHSPATMLTDIEFRRKPGSVGRPLPCMEARVVDDEGMVLGADQAGELHLRGSLVTTGYDGDPDGTAAAIDSDGWFATGDLARLDADGYVTILDRKKDMITRGGNKIFSVEVEQLLLRHPRIGDAAVVGIPDALAYEAVAAFVVPLVGEQVSPRDVKEWVATNMADYAVPRQVRVVDAIPRNQIGKISKPALRQRLLDELPHLRRAAERR